MASSLWALMMVMARAVAAAGCGEAALRAAEAAHEVLTAHDLPRCLLPAWIAAFSHDPATGRFEAALEAPHTARAEVDLRHNATVAGDIRTFREEEEEHPMQGTRSGDGEQRRHGASDFMARSNPELNNFIKQTTH